MFRLPLSTWKQSKENKHWFKSIYIFIGIPKKIGLYCKLTCLFFRTMNTITISALTKKYFKLYFIFLALSEGICAVFASECTKDISQAVETTPYLLHIEFLFHFFADCYEKNKNKYKITHFTFRQNIMREKWGLNCQCFEIKLMVKSYAIENVFKYCPLGYSS